MKLEFIKRGAATRLILIFTGWSTDIKYYSDCTVDGWDTAVVTDYRDMSMPEIPEQYATVYVFAYSLGVRAASQAKIDAAVRVAIFGTGNPVSDKFGIPESIYMGTADNLTENNLKKFHLRMSGDKLTCEKISDKLPANPKIGILKEELYAIAKYSKDNNCQDYYWHRAYISAEDRIIPTESQQRYWSEHKDTETILLASPHAADIKPIIEECIPNPAHIGEAFANAKPTYKKYAKIQSEVCKNIGEMLDEMSPSQLQNIKSILEIGPGKGLLTEEWGKRIHPEKATYVDLYEMQLFGNADDERYLVRDAEKWLEESGEKFDMILSASAIQWFADPIRFIDTAWNHLKPGGIAILSTFIKGNLKELDALRPSPIIYHTLEEYMGIFFHISGGFKTMQWISTFDFNSPRDLLLHLKKTGVQPSAPNDCGIPREPIKLTSLPKRLTYMPLIINIVKP